MQYIVGKKYIVFRVKKKHWKHKLFCVFRAFFLPTIPFFHQKGAIYFIWTHSWQLWPLLGYSISLSRLLQATLFLLKYIWYIKLQLISGLGLSNKNKSHSSSLKEIGINAHKKFKYETGDLNLSLLWQRRSLNHWTIDIATYWRRYNILNTSNRCALWSGKHVEGKTTHVHTAHKLLRDVISNQCTTLKIYCT